MSALLQWLSGVTVFGYIGVHCYGFRSPVLSLHYKDHKSILLLSTRYLLTFSNFLLDSHVLVIQQYYIPCLYIQIKNNLLMNYFVRSAKEILIDYFCICESNFMLCMYTCKIHCVWPFNFTMRWKMKIEKQIVCLYLCFKIKILVNTELQYKMTQCHCVIWKHTRRTRGSLVRIS